MYNFNQDLWIKLKIRIKNATSFNLHCCIEAVVYIVNALVQNRILWGLFVIATLNFLGFIVIWGCQDNYGRELF